MNLKTFRIGNIVESVHFGRFRIGYIENDPPRIGHDRHDDEDLADVSPVEITDKELYQLGFNYTEKDGCWHLKDFEMEIYIHGKWVVSIAKHHKDFSLSFQKEVRHVHELQNFIYECTKIEI